MHEHINPATIRRLLVIHALLIAISIVSVILAGRDVKAYRTEIAEKYGINCAWYEKPVFYDKDVRLYYEDYTGKFIVQHNRFDILNIWSGKKADITGAEMARFEELQDIYVTRWLWLAIAIFVPILAAILFFGYELEQEE